MYKLVALLLGPVAMAVMVYSFGFLSIPVCFALALGTLLFSNGPADEESVRFAAAQRRDRAGEPSSFMGAL
ncbi:hypothetical protein [Variovorax sp. ZT4R33]|uniref:hypothetical protein n=1 Tax=Variovorax sp. ZT4R33 TaxID=3443743 RepID=UPI003F4818DA